MASANFTVNTSACPPEKAVAYGATVTLALLSTAFNTATWSIVGTDRPSTPLPTITPGGSPLGATATFTMVADPGTGLGAALLVQCKINGGRDAAGKPDATLVKTAIVGVVNASGNVPFVVGETLERNATHGYTALLNQALVATGSPGATGPGLVGACDAIATSNISLSGTSAIDGVTLTANVSRVLCVGQTTTSQNGPWLVQSGAWTRPSDFSSDAQVAASQGTPLYVKPGGLTGGNANWQMTLGTAIAGAKTYEQLRTGAGRAPVRAIQTAAFPGTYSAGVWTATATGALSATIFDGLTIAIGEDVEVGQGDSATPGTAHIGNGIFRRGPDVASKPTFPRRTDLDSAADFVGGAAYDVLDGSPRNKSSRRQILNQGAIVLGTTLIQCGQVVANDQKEVNLATDLRYLAQFATDGTIAPDISAKLQAAVDDLQLAGAGPGGTIRMPMGKAYNTDPIRFLPLPGVKILASGIQKTVLNGAGAWGGPHFVWAGDTAARAPQFSTAVAATGYPFLRLWMTEPVTTLTASFVQPAVGSNRQITVGDKDAMVNGANNSDALGVNQTFRIKGGGYYQLVSYDSPTLVTVKNLGNPDNLAPGATVPASVSGALLIEIPAHAADVSLNMSQAGLAYDRQAAIDNTFQFRLDDPASALIYGRSGQLAGNDSSVAESLVVASGTVTWVIRLWSATGVVSAGSSPPVMTITGTLRPDVMLYVECTLGGARGTAKIRVSACFGWGWSEENILTAASVTLTQGRLAGIILNFANTSFNTNNYWTNYDTLTLAKGGLTAGIASEEQTRCIFNGATGVASLYLDRVGTTYGSTYGGPATATTSLPSPVVHELPFEESIVGWAGFLARANNCARISLSVVNFRYNAGTPSGTVQANGPTNDGNTQAFTATQPAGAFWSRAGRDDGIVWRWVVANAPSGKSGSLIFRRNSLVYGNYHEVRDFTIDNSNTNRAAFLVGHAMRHFQADNIETLGGSYGGFYWDANGFENSIGGGLISTTASKKFGHWVRNCQNPFKGTIATYDLGVQVSLAVTSGCDATFLLYSDTSYAGLVYLQGAEGGDLNVSYDDEGGLGAVYAACAEDHNYGLLRINGVISAGNGSTCIPVMARSYSGAPPGGPFELNATVFANAACAACVNIRDANIAPVSRGPGYSGNRPFSNRPSKTIAFGGRLDPVVATNADTVLTVGSVINTLQVPASTFTGSAKNYTLSDTGADEGYEWRVVLLGTQAQNLVIKDHTGATIDTIASGTGRSTTTYRKDGTGHFVVFS